jgi:hypothetical protein
MLFCELFLPLLAADFNVAVMDALLSKRARFCSKGGRDEV